MKISLVQLEYIIALDTYRHFAKAANHCFVTQPTLSMQIQKLEDSLGVRVFDRSKQPVMPTDIGMRIIEQARQVVAEAKRIEELIDEEKGEVKGELTLGVIPTVAPYLLPHFITSFVDKYPRVRIVVKEMLTEEVIRHLKNELLDIGIVVTPINEPSLKISPLYFEEFFAYISTRSALSEKKKLGTADLASEKLWLLSEGHCFREQVLNICRSKDYSEDHFEYESGSLEVLKNMVDRQGGLTLLPELATVNFSKELSKRLLPFQKPVPIREVSLVTKRSFLKQKLVEALRKEIIDSLPPSLGRSQNGGEIISWR